jgi:hypothetical protein
MSKQNLQAHDQMQRQLELMIDEGQGDSPEKAKVTDRQFDCSAVDGRGFLVVQVWGPEEGERPLFTIQASSALSYGFEMDKKRDKQVLTTSEWLQDVLDETLSQEIVEEIAEEDRIPPGEERWYEWHGDVHAARGQGGTLCWFDDREFQEVSEKKFDEVFGGELPRGNEGA